MKYLKRGILFLCTMTGFWSGISANEVSHVMRVTLTDGTIDTYIVADHLNVDLDADSVYVSTIDISFAYEVGVVESYTFADITTGIEEVLNSDNEEGIVFKYVDGKTVVIRGCKPNSLIQVYSLSGQKQKVEMAKYENGADVSLQSLPTGTYIVSVKNGKSIKVVKR